MKKILLVFAIIFSTKLSARSSILPLINEEIDEIKRIMKVEKTNKGEYYLRLSELSLEKARIIKLSENSKYLSISSKKRGRISKKKFFKRSRSYFRLAQKYATASLKYRGKARRRAEVYYILGQNAKEFNRFSKSIKLFKKSEGLTRPRSNLWHRNSLAIAELYYNRGEYNKAITYYSRSLKTFDDRWWTKDAFNLAWSYFRERRYEIAISYMKKVFRKSKNKNYINMEKDASQALAFFFSQSKNPDQALKFFKNNKGQAARNMLMVSKGLIAKGEMSKARKTLTQAKKLTNDLDLSSKIDWELLLVSSHFLDYRLHYNLLEKFVTGPYIKIFDRPDKKSISFEIKKFSSRLQRMVAKKTYQHNESKQGELSTYVGRYLDLYKVVDKSGRYKADFHKAETFFAASKWSLAYKSYSDAFTGAKQSNDRSYLKRSLEGLMASLEKVSKERKVSEAEYLEAYKKYLLSYPRGKKSFKIYQRLFSLYLKSKASDSAEKLISVFSKAYPKSRTTVEAMIGKILDLYKTNRDILELKRWQKKIQGQYRFVNSRMKKKLAQSILAIQFEGVENSTSAGDKKKALSGYLQLYKDRDTGANAKKNAAYNIGVLFYELGEMKRSSKWLEKAFSQMPRNEIRKFEETFLLTSVGLLEKFHFKRSIGFNEAVLKKICGHKSKVKDSIFGNLMISSVATEQTGKNIKFFKMGISCGIGKKIELKMGKEIFRKLIKSSRLAPAEKLSHFFLNDLKKAKSVIPELHQLADLLQSYNKRETYQKIQRVFDKLVKNRKAFKVGAYELDLMVSARKKSLLSYSRMIERIELSFPEKRFNQMIEGTIAKLAAFQKSLESLSQTGSPDLIVHGHSLLIRSYLSFSKKIRNFYPPKASPDYLRSFRPAMSSISGQLDSQAKKLRNELRALIKSEDIITSKFYPLDSRVVLPFSFGQKDFILMERRGLQ